MVAPDDVHTLAASRLSALDAHRREEFALRLDRWWDDLVTGCTAVYADPLEVAARLVDLAATAYAERDPDLHRLDQRRLLQPDWLQQPRMFGYACYADRFAGNLAGVASHTDYLADLGVTYLHLMPVLRPREGDNDGGYAVADYRSLRPDLGSVEDLARLAGRLRGAGISLVLDLVLNHVAREHPWAVAARAGDPHFRAYFHLYPDRSLPEEFERTLPEVFPDFAPGNFSYDDEAGAWVWTTFNEWQWDLNWANPDVLAEFCSIALFLANLGVEVLRLDAIAFLWKRLGTDCQNQPEVHWLTQILHAATRMGAPALAFKAEAIVSPDQLVGYLGRGPHTGRVSDLAYHNSLMVQVWSMLATRDSGLARHVLNRLPAAPSSATWITYLRCHDDIGWAITDEDAAAVGLNAYDHRRFLAQWYAGDFGGSWSDGLIFQANPETGDARISGTAASLLGLDAEPAEGAAADAAYARIFVAHAIVAAWGGIPVIWSGDELGQGNDPHWAAEPGHEADNRWAHRPRLDWRRAQERHDLRTPAGRVFSGIAHLARVRAGLPALHASATITVLDTDPGVLGYARHHPAGTFVGLYNLGPEPRAVPLSLIRAQGVERPFEALGGHRLVTGADGVCVLLPYAAWWLVDRA